MFYSQHTVWNSGYLTSGNPVLLAPNMQGDVFIGQIMGDAYTYDHANELFISSGAIDHDMAEDIQGS